MCAGDIILIVRNPNDQTNKDTEEEKGKAVS